MGKPSSPFTEEQLEEKAQARAPNAGPFNATTTAALSMGAFGTLGYWIGKTIGKLGDDWNKPSHGLFETVGKWIGAGTFGAMAASVAIRHSREAHAQAVTLAKESIILEQRNEALESASPEARVQHAQEQGTMKSPTAKSEEMARG